MGELLQILRIVTYIVGATMLGFGVLGLLGNGLNHGASGIAYETECLVMIGTGFAAFACANTTKD